MSRLPKKAKYDIDETDAVIKEILETFEYQQEKNSPLANMTLNKLRLRHPLFSRITPQAFKILMENSFLNKVQAGSAVYREGQHQKNTVKVIMFGQFQCQSIRRGKFGARMCVGHTLGEECLFQDESSLRKETVIALQNSCLLQISKEVICGLKNCKDSKLTGQTLSKDFLLIRYILQNHYEQKSQWREEALKIQERVPDPRLMFPLKTKI